MKTKASQNAHRGSDFRDFLAEEGILPDVEVLALDDRLVFVFIASPAELVFFFIGNHDEIQKLIQSNG